MSIWLALAHDMHADAKLRKAKARAIWPWVLCRLKDDGGSASDNSLDPWRASDDHDGIFSEDQAAAMLASLRSVGLLVRTDDGRWTTPNWRSYQSDPTATDRKRAQRRREAAEHRGKANVTDVTRDKRDVTPVTDVTPTGQDTTGQIAADAAATRAPAHTHEDAPPPAPGPNPGQKTNTNSNTPQTGLRPHPMPVKAPKMPLPGDTTIRDRADELVRGSPAADRLRPLAEVAIEVTGYDVGIHTLAQWLSGNYTVERVRAGCAFAVQKYVGQCVPEGVVINTASRWMQRARPDEYPQARAPLAIVPPPPAAPERVRTPEEQAEIMRQFDELTMRLSEPDPAAKTASARGR